MILYSQCHVALASGSNFTPEIIIVSNCHSLRQVFALIAWGIFTTNIAEIVQMVIAALPTYSSLG